MAAGTATTIRTTTSAASALGDRRGRRRRPIRCRRECGRFWRSRREQRTPHRCRRCSATGERPCRSGKRPIDRIETLWKEWPAGLDAAGAAAREEAARDARAAARRLPQAGSKRDAGRARVLASAAGRMTPADRLDVCALAGRSAKRHDGARVREPRLAGVFRHRPGEHAGGLRHRKASRRRIQNCSIGWRSSSWTTAGASSIFTG